jgi:hypothetical protein
VDGPRPRLADGDLQACEPEGEDDELADDEGEEGRDDTPVGAALGQPADRRGGEDEADDVAAAGAPDDVPAALALRVEGKEQTEQRVKREGGRTATGAERGADESDGERLPGHRDGRRRDVEGDLGEQRREQRAPEDEHGVAHARARDRIGEDGMARQRAGGGNGGHRGPGGR